MTPIGSRAHGVAAGITSANVVVPLRMISRCLVATTAVYHLADESIQSTSAWLVAPPWKPQEGGSSIARR